MLLFWKCVRYLTNYSNVHLNTLYDHCLNVGKLTIKLIIKIIYADKQRSMFIVLVANLLHFKKF